MAPDAKAPVVPGALTEPQRATRAVILGAAMGMLLSFLARGVRRRGRA